MRRLAAGFSLFAILFSSAPARATPLFATFYTLTPGEGIAQGGSYNYFDDTGSQLIDGVYGANDFSADLGNGNAYEWVGWKTANPVMTFTFSSPVIINQVGIDFNRNEGAAGIYLPPTVTIAGTDFPVDPNAIPDATRGTLFFAGSWSGPTLTLTLTDNDPTRWLFVDEVTFDGVVVPEPSARALLAGALGLLALRRALPVRVFSRFFPARIHKNSLASVA